MNVVHDLRRDEMQISMDYDPEGDILSITFGAPDRKGRGYELSDHIYIRIDLSTHEPLGLTILSYSKLLALGEISLSFWGELTPEAQEIMRTILNSEPVNRFSHLKEMTIPVPYASS
ncbi:hypothetical protein HYR99_14455 [Candidatus Poribacteria bacterium]|nr:hypothetical protein [Candidatus Poribacteria bacterium]